MGGEHAIYALIDPRDMTVRYVGKTTDPKRRLAEHTANKMSARDVRPWLQELLDAGLAPVMEILDRASASEWERAEQYWIGFYVQRGRLLNVEVGGRGYLHAYRKRVRWAKQRLG
jgi:predicted GIY-YIG superfamily endonuclease